MSTTATDTPTTAADTIAAAIPYLASLAKVIEGMARTSPETVTKVQTALQDLQISVEALAASQTATQSKPIVDKIEAAGMAILQAAGSMALPSPFNIIAMVAPGFFQMAISTVKQLMVHRVTVPTPLPAAT